MAELLLGEAKLEQYLKEHPLRQGASPRGPRPQLTEVRKHLTAALDRGNLKVPGPGGGAWGRGEGPGRGGAGGGAGGGARGGGSDFPGLGDAPAQFRPARGGPEQRRWQGRKDSSTS